MGFDGLLGNQRLKDNLTNSVRRGKLSHFYLISGPEGSGKHTLARLLAAAALCQSGDKPCLTCKACRQALADTHPDVITVVDPDHKTVPVKQVRQIRDNLFIRPNQADRKLYIFPQELGVEGYNALLKVLEEPPAYGMFLLLTERPDTILPTIRSRCTELTLQPLAEPVLRQALAESFPQAEPLTLAAAIQRSGGYLGQAKALLSEDSICDPQTEVFLRCYGGRDALELVQLMISMERWKRDQLLPVLIRWKDLVQQALLFRSGVQAVSQGARELAAQRRSAELMVAIRHLQRTIDYARGNVSVAAICGFLAWALR